MPQPQAKQALPDHNYKVIGEGGETMYFIAKEAAKSAHAQATKVNIKTWIMFKLPDGSYVPFVDKD